MVKRECTICEAPFEVQYPSTRKATCSKDCQYTLMADTRDSSGKNNSNWRGGTTSHPLYDIYMDMIGRCERESHQRYQDYGGRGITVCTSWREDFWSFVKDMGNRPDGMWLDRIDNDGNYEPSNTRWVTPSESNRNRRTSGWEQRERTNEGRFI